MFIKEMGVKDGKTLVLLPGTGCTCEVNFVKVLDELASKYHLICVDYDGFEPDESIRTEFTDILSIVSKVEDYIIEKHAGKVDGVYGSSLGGTLASQLVVREKIHVDHCFLGSSDLDESGKLWAKIVSGTFGTWLENCLRDEKKVARLKRRFKVKSLDTNANSGSIERLDGLMKSIRSLPPGTIKKEFYSDYVTRLAKDIEVEGTTVHIIYALKMGKKYEKRYLKHFKNPDIIRIDMNHEGWLFEPELKEKVLGIIQERMSK